MHQVWPSASSPHPSTLPAHTTNGRDQTVEHSTLAHAEPLGIPFSSQCARTADSLTRSQAYQSSNICLQKAYSSRPSRPFNLCEDRPIYSRHTLAHTAYHTLSYAGFRRPVRNTALNSIEYLDGSQIDCSCLLSTLPSPFHVVGKPIWKAQPPKKRRQA